MEELLEKREELNRGDEEVDMESESNMSDQEGERIEVQDDRSDKEHDGDRSKRRKRRCQGLYVLQLFITHYVHVYIWTI